MTTHFTTQCLSVSCSLGFVHRVKFFGAKAKVTHFSVKLFRCSGAAILMRCCYLSLLLPLCSNFSVQCLACMNMMILSWRWHSYSIFHFCCTIFIRCMSFALFCLCLVFCLIFLHFRSRPSIFISCLWNYVYYYIIIVIIIFLYCYYVHTPSTAIFCFVYVK